MSKRRTLRQTDNLEQGAAEAKPLPSRSKKGAAEAKPLPSPLEQGAAEAKPLPSSEELAGPHPEDRLRRRHRLNIRLHLRRKKRYVVALYGDSISKGIVWDDESSRYKVLTGNYATLLGQRLKGTLSNRAMFGMTMGKATTRSVKDLDAMKPDERPDMVLVEYGGNDCDFDWEAIARDPAAHHGPKTDISLFRELLRALIVRFSNRHVLPVLLTLPPLDADRYFAWVSRNTPEAAANILAWLGSVSKIYWWQERYNAAILEVAAETGTHVVDVRSAFLREPDYRDFLCSDGIHPNGEGHALIATRVGDWLERFCGRMLREHPEEAVKPMPGKPLPAETLSSKPMHADKKDHDMV